MRASVDLLSTAGGWEVLSSKQPHTHTDLGGTHPSHARPRTWSFLSLSTSDYPPAPLQGWQLPLPTYLPAPLAHISAAPKGLPADPTAQCWSWSSLSRALLLSRPQSPPL